MKASYVNGYSAEYTKSVTLWIITSACRLHGEGLADQSLVVLEDAQEMSWL